MPEQPNKPAGAFKDGAPRPVDEQQAVKNQGSVTPDDYPDAEKVDVSTGETQG